MGKETAIEWTRHSFNPWWGCEKVSPGCKQCYAEAFAKRVGQRVWGGEAPRRFFGDAHWAEPLKWNAAARAAGERHRVFCASMADVFEDRRDLDEHRERLWRLIESTPDLDWLLLTKRPENMLRLAPDRWSDAWPRNVWAGATVEDQEHAAGRVTWLFRVPAAVRFLSCEPLLGPVDLTRVEIVPPRPPNGPGVYLNALTGHVAGPDDILPTRLSWVIVGSESGPGARPMQTDWARALVDQCVAAGVPVFTKQIANQHDRKGGDPAFWPPGNWPREFPEVARG